jgi:hypothetical protein
MVTNWIIFLIIGIAVIVGIEYLSRSFPPPWRMITLGIVVVVMLIWLLNLAGLATFP